MKLLLVTARFPFGGKESFLTEEVAQLARDFDVIVLPATPTDEPLAVPALEGRAVRMPLLSSKVVRMALAETIRRPFLVARTFATVVAMRRTFRAKVRNIAIFPTALAAARLVRERGIEHVHGYWLTTPSTIAYVVSRLCAIPWSASGHRHDLVPFSVRNGTVPRPGFFSSAQFIRTISRQGKDLLRPAFSNGAPPLRVIPLGVLVPPPCSPPNRNDGVLRLLCAANLEPVKGHDVLLEALQRAGKRVNVHCTIAGDGTLRSDLETKARELGLEGLVTFEGVVPHAQLLGRMSAGEFDAAILASLDEGPQRCEGIPVFLMESMARGLPVIATGSGAVGELVNHSNGILCAPGDVNALGDAIVRLAEDTAFQNILGRGGRKTILEDFDACKTTSQLAEALLEKRARLGPKTLAGGAVDGRTVVLRGSTERDEAQLQS
ncbi:MAG: glycosyltransferase [Candidatus Eremiobacteraeota bacterium]|nr:glycosyltransferase [Candidatus Eremiobacteraeota bacterium]